MRRILAFTLFLALPLAVLAAADTRLVFADGLWRRGLHASAASEYESILQAGDLAPEVAADVRFRLAECYEAMNKQEMARDCFRQVISATTGERKFAAQLRLASSLLEAGKAKDAQPLLEALMAMPGTPELEDAAKYRLGVCYETLGRRRDATTLYRLLLKRGGEYAAFSRLRLADLIGQTGKQKEALKLCDDLLNDPVAEARHNAAANLAFRLAYSLQDFEAAAGYARKLGEVELGKAELLLSAAWASAKANVPQEARAWLAAEKLRKPQATADRLWLEGAISTALGDDAGALTAYERILSEFPKSELAAQAAEAMLSIRAKAGDPKGFLGHYSRVEAFLSPATRTTLAPYVLDAAVQTRNLKATAEAATLIAETGEAKPAAEAAYRHAWLLQQLGDEPAAAEAWLASAERWPTAPTAGRAAYAAAITFRKNNAPDRAETALAFALKSGDAEVLPDALMLKARTQLSENDIPGAATTIDEYLTRFPMGTQAAEAAYLRGLIFFNAKDFIAADKTLAKALSLGAEGQTAGPTPLPHARRTDAALRRAQALHVQGRGDEAAALLQPLLGLKDAEALDPAYLRWLADFRLGRKEWAAAETAAKLLAEKSAEGPDRVLAQTLLGRAAEGQGAAATAITAYEAALAAATTPTQYDAEAALGLGRLRLAEGTYAKAREAFTTAIARVNTDQAIGLARQAEALTGLAKACAALNLPEEALRADMRLIIFYDDPAIVSAAFDRAISNLNALGRTAEAENLKAEKAQRYPSK